MKPGVMVKISLLIWSGFMVGCASKSALEASDLRLNALAEANESLTQQVASLESRLAQLTQSTEAFQYAHNGEMVDQLNENYQLVEQNSDAIARLAGSSRTMVERIEGNRDRANGMVTQMQRQLDDMTVQNVTRRFDEVLAEFASLNQSWASYRSSMDSQLSASRQSNARAADLASRVSSELESLNSIRSDVASNSQWISDNWRIVEENQDSVQRLNGSIRTLTREQGQAEDSLSEAWEWIHHWRAQQWQSPQQ